MNKQVCAQPNSVFVAVGDNGEAGMEEVDLERQM